uniref:Uncharacterized protein n=1 Tax=Cacopsylla melanoneura TaxID=428564 RepID=A0A8D8QJ37_9HEMI
MTIKEFVFFEFVVSSCQSILITSSLLSRLDLLLTIWSGSLVISISFLFFAFSNILSSFLSCILSIVPFLCHFTRFITIFCFGCIVDRLFIYFTIHLGFGKVLFSLVIVRLFPRVQSLLFTILVARTSSTVWTTLRRFPHSLNLS